MLALVPIIGPILAGAIFSLTGLTVTPGVHPIATAIALALIF